MNKGIRFLLVALIAGLAVVVGFALISSNSFSTQPIHLNSNQTIISIGNGWEKVVINKTDVASFKNLTKNSIGFISACNLYFFISNDINNNVITSITSIIEFPNVLNSTSPVTCFSAIWGGEETLNIKGNSAHNIITQYNGESGANLILR